MRVKLSKWDCALSAISNALSGMCDRRLRGQLFARPAALHAQRLPRSPALRAERGFTLAEVMVTVSVAGVLSATAAPSFMDVVATQRVKSATFELLAATNYARSEAIKRNAVVTVTPRSGSFVNGYDLTTGGEILRSNDGVPSVAFNAPAVALAFDGSGRLTTAAQYQLELNSSQVSNIAKRCLIVSTSGRPSIRVDSDLDGNCANG